MTQQEATETISLVVGKLRLASHVSTSLPITDLADALEALYALIQLKRDK